MYLGQANIKSLPIRDNSIDLIFTDAPYPKKYLACYEWLANEAMRVLKPKGFILVMCGGLFLNKIYRMFDDAGLVYFYEMSHRAYGNAPTVWKHCDSKKYPIVAKVKPILAYSKGESLPRVGGVMNFVENPSDNGKTFHHWGQDVASARYYIDNFSKEGDFVLDPFIGGGTTAVACGLIRRRCIGFDIDVNALVVTRDRLLDKGEAPYINLPLFANP